MFSLTAAPFGNPQPAVRRGPHVVWPIPYIVWELLDNVWSTRYQ
jgi:hypothetical protein